MKEQSNESETPTPREIKFTEKMTKLKCPRHPDQFVNLVNLSEEANINLCCTLCVTKLKDDLKIFLVDVGSFAKIEDIYMMINDEDVYKILNQLKVIQKIIDETIQEITHRIAQKSYNDDIKSSYGIPASSVQASQNEYKEQITRLNTAYHDIHKKANKEEKRRGIIIEEIKDQHFQENKGISILQEVLDRVKKSIDNRIQQNKEIQEFLAKTKKEKLLKFIDQGQKIMKVRESFCHQVINESALHVKELIIEHAMFENKDHAFSEELAKSDWKELEKIEIKEKIDPTTFEQMTKRQYFSKLKEFSLENRKKNVNYQAYAEHLRVVKWRQLYVLRIQECLLDNSNLNSLIENETFSLNLKELNLQRNALTSDGIVQFVKLKCPNLRRLSFNGNQIGLAGFNALIDSNNFNNLSHLNILQLNQIKISEDFNFRLIAESKLLENISSLSLRENGLSNEQVLRLFFSKLTNLEELNLESNQMTLFGYYELLIRFVYCHVNSCIPTKQVTFSLNQNKINLGSIENKFEKTIITEILKYNEKITKHKFILTQSKQSKQFALEATFSTLYPRSLNHDHFLLSAIEDLTQKEKIYKYFVENQFKNQSKCIQEDVTLNKFTENIFALYSETMQKTRQLEEESVNLIEKLMKNSKEGESEFALMWINKWFQNESKVKNIIFTLETTIETQMGLKILFSKIHNPGVKFVEKLNVSTFKHLNTEENQDKSWFLRHWYTLEKSKQFDLDPLEIIVYSIELNQDIAIIEWSHPNLREIISKNQTLKNIYLENLHQRVYLTPQSFIKGQIQSFPEATSKMRVVGGWPHYPPIYAHLYQIQYNYYADKTSQWREMGANPKEWAVAYCGFNMLDQCLKSNEVRAQYLAKQGNEKLLLCELNQHYKDTNSLNFSNVAVGNGIYCSPFFNKCLESFSNTAVFNSISYSAVLMIKIKPKKIKVCENNIFWVINSTEDIRPYGLVLIKSELKDRLIANSPEQIYGETFSWDSHKTTIEAYEAQFA